MQPTPGMPVFKLSNNVELSYWFENDSESIWFIYRIPGEPEYRGGGLNFQMGDAYIGFMKGAEEYKKVCVAKMNQKIRELFPALFDTNTPPDVVVVPAEIANIGPLTKAFAEGMMGLKLVNNQFQ